MNGRGGSGAKCWLLGGNVGALSVGAVCPALGRSVPDLPSVRGWRRACHSLLPRHLSAVPFMHSILLRRKICTLRPLMAGGTRTMTVCICAAFFGARRRQRRSRAAGAGAGTRQPSRQLSGWACCRSPDLPMPWVLAVRPAYQQERRYRCQLQPVAVASAGAAGARERCGSGTGEPGCQLVDVNGAPQRR
jgi:hypothetical protein